jgi:hypothetical protein
MPVVEVPTPFGTIPFGNARAGVCGGMIFAALDCYLHGVPVPPEPTRPVFRYLVRRLFQSWDLPLGGPRYYSWQTRPARSRVVGGVRLRAGVSYLTAAEEWPKVQALLDAGMPASLGLVNVATWDPRAIGRNHQVLAYGYELLGDAVEVKVYDPNYPCDDALTLRLELADPDAGRPVRHGIEGPTCRGFFQTEYRKPPSAPAFG